MSNLLQNQNKGPGLSERVSGLLRNLFQSSDNWESCIESSGLPGTVQVVIHKIAIDSRLMRSETMSVVKEMVSHFQDGAERGVAYSKLLDDFGDSADVSELIRVNKIRNRSMFVKYGRASAFFGLGALGLYIGAIIFFNLGKPNPSIDYMAEFNQPLDSIPEEDKAWNVYRDVWGKFGFCEGQKGRFPELYYRNPEDPADTRLIRPGDKGWQVAIDRLDEASELLESFREGAKLPVLGVSFFADRSRYSREDRAALFPDNDPDAPFDDQPLYNNDVDEDINQVFEESMIGVLLPNIQPFRAAARMLVVDSRWALEQDDVERVVQNVETIMGLSKHVSDPDFLVCSLVGIAVAEIGEDLLDEVLAESPDLFNEKQLARIQTAISTINPYTMIDFRGEELMVKDMIQRMFTDDGKGDGRLTRQGLKILEQSGAFYGVIGNESAEKKGWLEKVSGVNAISGPLSLINSVSRKELTQQLEDLVKEVEKDFHRPFWEGVKFVDFDQKFKDSPRGTEILSLLFPVVDQLHNAQERCLANRDGMLFAVAAHRYRLANSEWPDSLGDLMGSYLESKPVDRINGKPLSCKIVDGQFRVYSVGHDRDDDGGRSIQRTSSETYIPPGIDEEKWADEHDMVPLPASDFTFASSKHTDGDWVIWPRRSTQ